jgi:glutamine synthetase
MSQYTILKYIWIDNFKQIKSHTRIIHDLGMLNMEYITNSTESINHTQFLKQFPKLYINENSSELTLIPVAFFIDPFRSTWLNTDENLNNAYLILCECYENGIPTKYNSRSIARTIFSNEIVQNYETLSSIEQEYSFMCELKLFDLIIEEHLMYCLKAGINIDNLNDNAPNGLYKFRISENVGIVTSDHLWIARYILEEICKKHNITFTPTYLTEINKYKSSKLNVTFSTNAMRKTAEIDFYLCTERKPESNNKLGEIYYALHKLENAHQDHLEIYELDIANPPKFTYGTGTNVSIRIPQHVVKNKCGYIEDRRPAPNADPYLVTAKIAETICLSDDLLNESIEEID